MRVLSSLLICGLFISFSLTQAYAVDGYKDLKFGASSEEVLKNTSFSWGPKQQAGPGVTLYPALNFKFGGNIAEAAALFIGNKFLRFVIVVPVDQVAGVIKTLTEKYGPPSSSSDRNTFNAVDTTPNTEAYMRFDSDTVIVKVSSDALRQQSLLVIYTSLAYDSLLMEFQGKTMEGDL